MGAFAADDYAAIRIRMAEIAEAEIPRCPRNPGMKLAACLRSAAKCAPECPHAGDWIGPEAEG